MKQNKTQTARTKLQLAKETIRSLKLLSSERLGDVQGGMMHTSFSCGNDLCTTHYGNG